MALNLVKKNSSSPFYLQRSMVSQGGEGGAYESGGYTGQSTYSDGGVAESIAGFGKVFGAALGSRTAADDNASDVKKKSRLERKDTRLTEKRKGQTGMEDVSNNISLDKKIARNQGKIKTTDAKISSYNEITKPVVKSDIIGKTLPTIVNSKILTPVQSEAKSTTGSFDIGSQLKTDYSSNANLKPTVMNEGVMGTIKKLFNRPQ